MRAAALAELQRAARPLTAQEMATALDVHHTAIRQHMAVLADAGLVATETLPPSGRGRPKVAYRVLADPQPYRHLATMLADGVAGGMAPIDIGREHGRRVAHDDDPLATLERETERLGFRPRRRDRGKGVVELVLQACPFADVAAAAPDVVCQLHRGLAEGIADSVGGLEVVDLHVADPHRAGCRLVTRAT